MDAMTATVGQHNPVEAWARDPRRIRAALDLLAQSKASTADGIQATGIEAEADPETIHLAVSIAWEGGCRRCSGELYGGMCPLGRSLYDEVETTREAYLDATGSDFDDVAVDEWKTWQAAENRLDAHIGVRR